MLREFGHVVAQREVAAALFRTQDELEQEIALRTRELMQSNESLERFAHLASHDLREPLRTVVSYLQLLELRAHDRLTDEEREFLHFAADGALRMRGLLDGIPTYSRLRRSDKGNTPVDLYHICTQVCQTLSLAIAEQQAEIDILPLPMVLADPDQMVRLLQNLIGNALRFRGEAQPCITIGSQPGGEGEAVFFVRDNGIGIAPEHYKRIFYIFQRLHPRSQYPGEGLGLSVCQEIVLRHGGRIWVESAPGAGATFFVALPT
ncbi:MAG: hypothetical protein OHK0039_46870 [Bacteroidia bacterium]